MSLLLVDGYNIINNWPEFEAYHRENLDAARVKLAEMLTEFVPLLWEKVIIVYDAYQVKGKPRVYREGNNLEVIFTGEGQTADAFIERLVSDLQEIGQEVDVASSDYLEQSLVLWKGGRRIPARELRERLLSSREELQRKYSSGPARDLLDDRLSDTIKQLLEKWRRG